MVSDKDPGERQSWGLRVGGVTGRTRDSGSDWVEDRSPRTPEPAAEPSSTPGERETVSDTQSSRVGSQHTACVAGPKKATAVALPSREGADGEQKDHQTSEFLLPTHRQERHFRVSAGRNPSGDSTGGGHGRPAALPSQQALVRRKRTLPGTAAASQSPHAILRPRASPASAATEVTLLSGLSPSQTAPSTEWRGPSAPGRPQPACARHTAELPVHWQLGAGVP